MQLHHGFCEVALRAAGARTRGRGQLAAPGVLTPQCWGCLPRSSPGKPALEDPKLNQIVLDVFIYT